MIKIARRFSKIAPSPESSQKSIVGAEIAESLAEYSLAMSMIQLKHWPMAELELQRCLEIIEKAGFYGEPSYSFVLQRLALPQKAQGKFNLCEKSLEDIVDNCKANAKKYPELLEKSYETLFKQYLSSNINKALRLGEVLTQENTWQGLTRKYQMDVKYCFGVNCI